MDIREQIIKEWYRRATERHERAKEEDLIMGDYEGKGYLARNKYATAENHPSHVGKITIDGVRYNLAAWIKQTDKGDRIFSLRANPPDKGKQQKSKQNQSQAKKTAAEAQQDLMTPLGDPELDDEIPF